MRFRSSFGTAVLLAASASILSAQTAAPARKPVPWKQYCQQDGGFCFKYPSYWTNLGEIFAGNGVVVAPPQKTDSALWDEVTVALVAPPPQGDEQGLGLNGVIEQATAGLREAGQNFQTLQRQERTVDGKPAQMLKTQYREKSSGRDWIEELVFIEGPDNEIYSIALKCAPQSLARLEPTFTRMLNTWTLPQPVPPPSVDDDSADKPTPPANAPTSPAEAPH
jgi:hypothetical protein